MVFVEEETRRTSALAFWRYAHDYLRTAQSLCSAHRLLCAESQVAYHLAAQALEFALKAFLRAAGVPADELRDRIRHSLASAFDRALELGLPPPPEEALTAIEDIAPHHQDFAFAHMQADDGEYPDLEPLFGAVHWLLDVITPAVARDYAAHYAAEASPSADELVGRLRADLAATASAG